MAPYTRKRKINVDEEKSADKIKADLPESDGQIENNESVIKTKRLKKLKTPNQSINKSDDEIQSSTNTSAIDVESNKDLNENKRSGTKKFKTDCESNVTSDQIKAKRNRKSKNETESNETEEQLKSKKGCNRKSKADDETNDTEEQSKVKRTPTKKSNDDNESNEVKDLAKVKRFPKEEKAKTENQSNTSDSEAKQKRSNKGKFKPDDESNEETKSKRNRKLKTDLSQSNTSEKESKQIFAKKSKIKNENNETTEQGKIKRTPIKKSKTDGVDNVISDGNSKKTSIQPGIIKCKRNLIKKDKIIKKSNKVCKSRKPKNDFEVEKMDTDNQSNTNDKNETNGTSNSPCEGKLSPKKSEKPRIETVTKPIRIIKTKNKNLPTTKDIVFISPDFKTHIVKKQLKIQGNKLMEDPRPSFVLSRKIDRIPKAIFMKGPPGYFANFPHFVTKKKKKTKGKPQLARRSIPFKPLTKEEIEEREYFKSILKRQEERDRNLLDDEDSILDNISTISDQIDLLDQAKYDKNFCREMITKLDNHVETMVEKHRVKRRPKRRSLKARLNELLENKRIDLNSPDSILTTVNLKEIINKNNFQLLPLYYQYHLTKLLPKCDQIMMPNNVLCPSEMAFSNEYISKAIVNFSKNLKDGKFTSQFLRKKKRYFEKLKKRLDPMKKKYFEPYFLVPEDQIERKPTDEERKKEGLKFIKGLTKTMDNIQELIENKKLDKSKLEDFSLINLSSDKDLQSILFDRQKFPSLQESINNIYSNYLFKDTIKKPTTDNLIKDFEHNYQDVQFTDFKISLQPNDNDNSEQLPLRVKKKLLEKKLNQLRDILLAKLDSKLDETYAKRIEPEEPETNNEPAISKVVEKPEPIYKYLIEVVKQLPKDKSVNQIKIKKDTKNRLKEKLKLKKRPKNFKNLFKVPKSILKGKPNDPVDSISNKDASIISKTKKCIKVLPPNSKLDKSLSVNKVPKSIQRKVEQSNQLAESDKDTSLSNNDNELNKNRIKNSVNSLDSSNVSIEAKTLNSIDLPESSINSLDSVHKQIPKVLKKKIIKNIKKKLSNDTGSVNSLNSDSNDVPNLVKRKIIKIKKVIPNDNSLVESSANSLDSGHKEEEKGLKNKNPLNDTGSIENSGELIHKDIPKILNMIIAKITKEISNDTSSIENSINSLDSSEVLKMEKFPNDTGLIHKRTTKVLRKKTKNRLSNNTGVIKSSVNPSDSSKVLQVEKNLNDAGLIQNSVIKNAPKVLKKKKIIRIKRKVPVDKDLIENSVNPLDSDHQNAMKEENLDMDDSNYCSELLTDLIDQVVSGSQKINSKQSLDKSNLSKKSQNQSKIKNNKNLLPKQKFLQNLLNSNSNNIKNLDKIVKNIKIVRIKNKSNNSSGKDCENVQNFPKKFLLYSKSKISIVNDTLTGQNDAVSANEDISENLNNLNTNETVVNSIPAVDSSENKIIIKKKSTNEKTQTKPDESSKCETSDETIDKNKDDLSKFTLVIKKVSDKQSDNSNEQTRPKKSVKLVKSKQLKKLKRRKSIKNSKKKKLVTVKRILKDCKKSKKKFQLKKNLIKKKLILKSALKNQNNAKKNSNVKIIKKLKKKPNKVKTMVKTKPKPKSMFLVESIDKNGVLSIITRGTYFPNLIFGLDGFTPLPPTKAGRKNLKDVQQNFSNLLNKLSKKSMTSELKNKIMNNFLHELTNVVKRQFANDLLRYPILKSKTKNGNLQLKSIFPSSKPFPSKIFFNLIFSKLILTAQRNVSLHIDSIMERVQENMRHRLKEIYQKQKQLKNEAKQEFDRFINSLPPNFSLSMAIKNLQLNLLKNASARTIEALKAKMKKGRIRFGSRKLLVPRSKRILSPSDFMKRKQKIKIIRKLLKNRKLKRRKFLLRNFTKRRSKLLAKKKLSKKALKLLSKEIKMGYKLINPSQNQSYSRSINSVRLKNTNIAKYRNLKQKSLIEIKRKRINFVDDLRRIAPKLINDIYFNKIYQLFKRNLMNEVNRECDEQFFIEIKNELQKMVLKQQKNFCKTILFDELNLEPKIVPTMVKDYSKQIKPDDKIIVQISDNDDDNIIQYNDNSNEFEMIDNKDLAISKKKFIFRVRCMDNETIVELVNNDDERDENIKRYKLIFYTDRKSNIDESEDVPVILKKLKFIFLNTESNQSSDISAANLIENDISNNSKSMNDAKLTKNSLFDTFAEYFNDTDINLFGKILKKSFQGENNFIFVDILNSLLTNLITTEQLTGNDAIQFLTRLNKDANICPNSESSKYLALPSSKVMEVDLVEDPGLPSEPIANTSQSTQITVLPLKSKLDPATSSDKKPISTLTTSVSTATTISFPVSLPASVSKPISIQASNPIKKTPIIVSLSGLTPMSTPKTIQNQPQLLIPITELISKSTTIPSSIPSVTAKKSIFVPLSSVMPTVASPQPIQPIATKSSVSTAKSENEKFFQERLSKLVENNKNKQMIVLKPQPNIPIVKQLEQQQTHSNTLTNSMPLTKGTIFNQEQIFSNKNIQGEKKIIPFNVLIEPEKPPKIIKANIDSSDMEIRPSPGRFRPSGIFKRICSIGRVQNFPTDSNLMPENISRDTINIRDNANVPKQVFLQAKEIPFVNKQILMMNDNNQSDNLTNIIQKQTTQQQQQPTVSVSNVGSVIIGNPGEAPKIIPIEVRSALITNTDPSKQTGTESQINQESKLSQPYQIGVKSSSINFHVDKNFTQKMIQNFDSTEEMSLLKCTEDGNYVPMDMEGPSRRRRVRVSKDKSFNESEMQSCKRVRRNSNTADQLMATAFETNTLNTSNIQNKQVLPQTSTILYTHSQLQNVSSSTYTISSPSISAVRPIQTSTVLSTQPKFQIHQISPARPVQLSTVASTQPKLQIHQIAVTRPMQPSAVTSTQPRFQLHQISATRPLQPTMVTSTQPKFQVPVQGVRPVSTPIKFTRLVIPTSQYRLLLQQSKKIVPTALSSPSNIQLHSPAIVRPLQSQPSVVSTVIPIISSQNETNTSKQINQKIQPGTSMMTSQTLTPPQQVTPKLAVLPTSQVTQMPTISLQNSMQSNRLPNSPSKIRFVLHQKDYSPIISTQTTQTSMVTTSQSQTQLGQISTIASSQQPLNPTSTVTILNPQPTIAVPKQMMTQKLQGTSLKSNLETPLVQQPQVPIKQQEYTEKPNLYQQDVKLLEPTSMPRKQGLPSFKELTRYNHPLVNNEISESINQANEITHSESSTYSQLNKMVSTDSSTEFIDLDRSNQFNQFESLNDWFDDFPPINNIPVEINNIYGNEPLPDLGILRDDPILSSATLPFDDIGGDILHSNLNSNYSTNRNDAIFSSLDINRLPFENENINNVNNNTNININNNNNNTNN